MPRTLLTLRWLIVHVLALALAGAFVALGLWQLDRLDQRRAANARLSAQLELPPAPLEGVLAEGGDLEYRRVTATGTYLAAEEVLLSPRSRDGVPGSDLLTPFALADGEAIVVDRGWVPLEFDTPPVTEVAPPAGEISVTGWLQRTARATRSGPIGADDVEFVSHVDARLLAEQTSQPLVEDVYLVAERDGSDGSLPRPPQRPAPDEGNHLSYAIQWFSFAGIALVGYPLLLRRRLRETSPRGRSPEGVSAAAPRT